MNNYQDGIHRPVIRPECRHFALGLPGAEIPRAQFFSDWVLRLKFEWIYRAYRDGDDSIVQDRKQIGDGNRQALE